jgi:hypothetical protein
MIYTALAKGPYKVPGYHDKDSKRLFGLIFRPAAWTTATVYSVRSDDDYDVVIPTVFTGLYYKATSPGKSGATEPTWGTTAGGTTTDGTTGLVWEAVAYNLMPVSETIASVTSTANYGVTLSGESNTTTSLQYMILPLPAAAIAAGSFEVTSHIVKSNAEELDVSVKFKVGQR